MESTQLDCWARVVNALPDDGRFRLARVEGCPDQESEIGFGLVCISLTSQCVLVRDFLWTTDAWLGGH